ncbi:MAG: hypothetical protein KAR20_06540 [Candidatus Heimdallarchaeota archaeon]|nr:hypothetical protein [Candidatus Heimdallarchaeota archaeon]
MEKFKHLLEATKLSSKDKKEIKDYVEGHWEEMIEELGNGLDNQFSFDDDEMPTESKEVNAIIKKTLSDLARKFNP